MTDANPPVARAEAGVGGASPVVPERVDLRELLLPLDQPERPSPTDEVDFSHVPSAPWVDDLSASVPTNGAGLEPASVGRGGPAAPPDLVTTAVPTLSVPPVAAAPTAAAATGQLRVGSATDTPASGGSMTQPAAPPAGVERPRRRRRRRRRHRLRWVLLGLLGLLVVIAGYYAVTLFQVWRTAAADQARPVDAIVVLGAAQYDGRPAPVLASRLDHVVDLYRRGLADTIVVTGGKQPADRFTEAAASARYLEARGVPASAILEETTGRNSYDSLHAAAVLLAQRNKHSVLLVSDPYHSMRIKGIAEELGLTAYTSPTRTSPIRGGDAFRRMAKEAAGISLARLIGYDRLKALTG